MRTVLKKSTEDQPRTQTKTTNLCCSCTIRHLRFLLRWSQPIFDETVMISSLRCVVDPSPGGVVETCKRFPGGCNCCKMLLRNSCITWYKKAQNLKHNVRYMFENYLLILACLALYRHFFLTCLVRQIWGKTHIQLGPSIIFLDGWRWPIELEKISNFFHRSNSAEAHHHPNKNRVSKVTHTHTHFSTEEKIHWFPRKIRPGCWFNFLDFGKKKKAVQLVG